MATAHRGGFMVIPVAVAILFGTTGPAEAGKCPAGTVSSGTGGICVIPVTTTISDLDSNGFSATIASACPLPHKFNYGSSDYRLDAAPSWSHYPETTDVQVRCNTADAGGCNDWFIDPIGLTESVGRLTHSGTVNHKTQAIDDGDFYMKFHIHITRP